jgi:hypothetical protein
MLNILIKLHSLDQNPSAVSGLPIDTSDVMPDEMQCDHFNGSKILCFNL